jgi:hypothetical protein
VKTIVAWAIGIWTPLQLAMLAVKMWVRTDWHWAVVLIPSEALGVAIVVVVLLFLYVIWSLGRGWEGLDD